jgi:transposase, IS5 family
VTMAVALAGRREGSEGQERRIQRYRELVSLTREILHQAEGVLEETQKLPSSRRAARLKPLREILETITGRVRQVIRQTTARVFQGITQYPHKIVSIFEPHTEIIRKGKASKPNEFGNLVKVQEAENQIITHYEVFAERPEDSRLLIPAVEQHQRQLGGPRMVAADTGFYRLKNERTIQAMGVRRVAVPSRSTKSSERRKLQRTRWFRFGQRWRTGCEGRISVLKRRHGLSRCRYRGFGGMQRWVGLGVIADNIIQIGRCLAARA